MDQELTEEQIDRYSRQLVLKNWGGKQQLALAKTSVTVCSSLPSACAYLVSAGIGELQIVSSTEPSEEVVKFAQFLSEQNPETKVAVNQYSTVSGKSDWLIANQESPLLGNPDLGVLARVEICCPAPYSVSLYRSEQRLKSVTYTPNISMTDPGLILGSIAVKLLLELLSESTTTSLCEVSV